MKSLILCLMILFVSCLAVAAEEDEALYYAVDREFGENDIEFGTGFLYSSSNPYLNIFGGSLDTYWIASDFWSFGLEGSLFGSNTRNSTKLLQNELDRHGYRIEAFAPKYSVRAAARFTPISSLSNIFSSAVLKTDVSLVARAGGSQFKTFGWGPSLGVGLDLGLRLRSGIGVRVAVLWDWDKIPSRDWENRVSFLIGPTVRF